MHEQEHVEYPRHIASTNERIACLLIVLNDYDEFRNGCGPGHLGL